MSEQNDSATLTPIDLTKLEEYTTDQAPQLAQKGLSAVVVLCAADLLKRARKRRERNVSCNEVRMLRELVQVIRVASTELREMEAHAKGVDLGSWDNRRLAKFIVDSLGIMGAEQERAQKLLTTMLSGASTEAPS